YAFIFLCELIHMISDMASHRLTLSRFLAGRGGQRDLNNQSEIFKFKHQVRLTTSSASNWQKRFEWLLSLVDLKVSTFPRLAYKRIDCKKCTPDGPLEVCRGFFRRNWSSLQNKCVEILHYVFPLFSLLVRVMLFTRAQKLFFQVVQFALN